MDLFKIKLKFFDIPKFFYNHQFQLLAKIISNICNLFRINYFSYLFIFENP